MYLNWIVERSQKLWSRSCWFDLSLKLPLLSLEIIVLRFNARLTGMNIVWRTANLLILSATLLLLMEVRPSILTLLLSWLSLCIGTPNQTRCNRLSPSTPYWPWRGSRPWPCLASEPWATFLVKTEGNGWHQHTCRVVAQTSIVFFLYKCALTPSFLYPVMHSFAHLFLLKTLSMYKEAIWILRIYIYNFRNEKLFDKC